MPGTASGENGSALIGAVVATLVLGLLCLALTLVSTIEGTMAFHGAREAEAEVLALAALDRAGDVLGSAASEPCGFTRWTSPSEIAGCGSPLGALLLDGVRAGNGTYSAVIDNDCAPTLVSAGIQDPSCAGGSPGRDENGTAVLTAFATAGPGRARVRALVAIDSAWTRVCAGHRADAGGRCDAPSGANGRPTAIPADPGSRHASLGLDDLPRPMLGCSRIDPTLHLRAGQGPATQLADCFAYPSMYGEPYPPHVGPGAPRFVLMGADPAVAIGAAACPGGGQIYFGYFDCALTTPCPATVCGSVRRACVRPGDARAVASPAEYVETVGGMCPVLGGVRQTGMAFRGPFTALGGTVGVPGAEVTVYVLDGRAQLENVTLWGTLVVEGHEDPGACPSDVDVQLGRNASIRVGALGASARGGQYGYPLAVLSYHPDVPPPTGLGIPQPTCVRLGEPSGDPARVSGFVYAGGHVESHAVEVVGGLVAFELQVSGSRASYRYDPAYGRDAPPPGFTAGPSRRVGIVRKSVLACASYVDDRGGGTACP